MQILDNYSLKRLNTFNIDVRAKKFTAVRSNEDVLYLREKGYFEKGSHLILGGGSNILFSTDYDGLVVYMDSRGREVVENDGESLYLKIMAGEDWDETVEHCVSMGWGGLENLSMIPGKAGSSPIQNIGAYGVELSEHFHSLEALEKSTGKIRTFSGEECRFGYRDSVFKQGEKGRYLILSVTLRLDLTPEVRTHYLALSRELSEMGVTNPSIAAVRVAVMRIRGRKLPDPKVLGNAGSFFKNTVISREDFSIIREKFPEIKYFEEAGGVKIAAGWLIDKAGWKGKRKGNAGVHQDQALVIVNHGGATGSDVLGLAADIKESVMDIYGIELQEEVNII